MNNMYNKTSNKMKKQILSEEFRRMQKLAGLISENQIDKNKELFIYLISAEDEPEHLVYALFDKDGKIIQSDFEDPEAAERWADENGYVATQL